MCTSDKSVNSDVECPWFSLVGEDCNLVSWVLRVFFICKNPWGLTQWRSWCVPPSFCWFPEDCIHGSHLEQRRPVGNPIVLVPCNVLVAIAQIQSLRKVFVKRTIWYRVFFLKVPPRQILSMELVPPNRIKSPGTLVPPKATSGAKNNQNWRFLTLQWE